MKQHKIKHANGSCVVDIKPMKSTSKTSIFLLLFLFSLFLIIIFYLGSNMGPPLAEGTKAETYLRSIGVDEGLIWSLQNVDILKQKDIVYLLSLPDLSVKYLLAMNPGLSREQRKMLWQEENEKVKIGVAANTST